MRENQLTVQNQILSLLKSEELNEKQADHFTAAWLAQKLNYSRNFISQLLNDLTDQRLCVKINTRPVYYFSRERLLQQGYAIPETLSSLSGWPQLNTYKLRKENDVFDRLVGAEREPFLCHRTSESRDYLSAAGLAYALDRSDGNWKKLSGPLNVSIRLPTGNVARRQSLRYDQLRGVCG